MAHTSHPLHPVAVERLEALTAQLEAEMGQTPSDRKIVNALVYGATAAQTVGMLEAFAKARRQYNDAHQGEPGEAARKHGGR
jgi:hypothetical protein